MIHDRHPGALDRRIRDELRDAGWHTDEPVNPEALRIAVAFTLLLDVAIVVGLYRWFA